MYIIHSLNFVAPGNMSSKIIRRTDYGSESQMAVSTLEMVKNRFLHQERAGKVYSPLYKIV